jgi:hypothetical protein
MRNEVIFDKSGIPDIMVAFTPDELGLPAELKGRKVEAYLIGKYPATMIDGVPHSLPFQKPAVDVNHDEAIRLCEAKGPGWHLTTNDEWAALAHQSRKNGTLPRGNTNSGKSHSHPEETGTTYEGGYGKTLTGSGPVTWNHDHTAEGVADMCGNVWEHVGGIRFVDGKVQVIPRNEAAAGADQSKDSPEWVNIYTADGDPIYYEVTDDEIWLRATEPENKDYCGVSFTDLEPGEVDNLDELIRLGLYPADGYEGSDYFWLDTNGERCVYRGGNWGSGAGAGVFYLYGSDARSYSDADLGFRPAFVRYSGDSGSLDNLDEGTPEIKTGTIDDAETLPGLMRLILAEQIAKLCQHDTAEGLHEITAKVLEADETEFREAGALLGIMAQVSAASAIYKEAVRQAKLATTTTITIRKEAADHE